MSVTLTAPPSLAAPAAPPPLLRPICWTRAVASPHRCSAAAPKKHSSTTPAQYWSYLSYFPRPKTNFPKTTTILSQSSRRPFGNWHLAIGDWRLAIGDWRLAIGDWRFPDGNFPNSIT